MDQETMFQGTACTLEQVLPSDMEEPKTKAERKAEKKEGC